jgi:hypothetical protein
MAVCLRSGLVKLKKPVRCNVPANRKIRYGALGGALSHVRAELLRLTSGLFLPLALTLLMALFMTLIPLIMLYLAVLGIVRVLSLLQPLVLMSVLILLLVLLVLGFVHGNLLALC